MIERVCGSVRYGRRLRGVVGLVGMLGLLAACDDITFSGPHTWPEGFVLDGSWEGEVRQGRFEMTLSQLASGAVTGAGAWIPRVAGSRAFRVEGLVSEDEGVVSLLLELSSTDHAPGIGLVLIHYRARPWGHQELRGRLNGGGFDDAVLVLRRTRSVGVI